MNIFKSYDILKEYRKDPIAYFTYLFKKNGHRTELQVLNKKVMVLTHPEDVMHILKDNHAAYSKGRTTKAMKDFLGDGLITSEGDTWRKQHRLIRPVMNPKNIYDLAAKMQHTSAEFLQKFEDGKSTDAFHAMNLLTWRIVLNTLFSQETTEELDQWLEDVLFLMETVTVRTRTLFKFPYWVPTTRHRRAQAIVEKFRKYIDKLIEERKKSEPTNDLLQILLNIKEEDGSVGMSQQRVKDEVLTFLMAGHETITNTMSWTLITLAKNPKYISKLREETDIFFKTQDFKELSSMPWHAAVVDETMRLWPPVYAFMRLAEQEDEVKGMKIPIKTNVVLCPFISHRAPDLWERPEEFIPERFMGKKIPPGIYYPFGLGPRACIGAHFATMEAKIILANIVHNWDWVIDKPEKQAYEATITLRPTNNIQMTFKKRAS